MLLLGISVSPVYIHLIAAIIIANYVVIRFHLESPKEPSWLVKHSLVFSNISCCYWDTLMQSIELTPSKFAQNSTITLIKAFRASTGAWFFVQICQRTLLPIANSTLTVNLCEVYSFKRHIYQQRNSLLLLSPLYYNHSQVKVGDDLM